MPSQFLRVRLMPMAFGALLAAMLCLAAGSGAAADAPAKGGAAADSPELTGACADGRAGEPAKDCAADGPGKAAEIAGARPRVRSRLATRQGEAACKNEG